MNLILLPRKVDPRGCKTRKKIYGSQYTCNPNVETSNTLERALTDEQVVEKKRMLRESAQAHPEIAEYLRELAVDFCVRFPEEATKQRETKEWEEIESQFSPKKMAALNNEYNESHNP